MTVGDDYSDILGKDTLPIRQKSEPNSFSLPVKVTFTLALLLVAYIIAARAWEYILKWREKSYRLSLRRRHGIPDNDHRPFNVAYAAVQRLKEQKEKEAARLRRVDFAAASSLESSNAQPESVRHRPGNQRGVDSSRSGAPVGGLPGRYNPMSMNSYVSMPSVSQSQSNRVTFADGYNTSASPLDVHAELASPTKRSGRKSLGILKSSDDQRKRERGYDDEDVDITKKFRYEGDELIDGDEEAEWQTSHNLQNSTSWRGSKRGLGEDDEGDIGTSNRTRGKKQRKVSGDKGPILHHDMDIDVEGEDYLSDLKSLSRGKKRDRDEAGSSYGGDLGQEDDDTEFDAEDEKARRRKRRNKRRSDANSGYRGKKRDRDLEDELGDIEDETSATSQRMLRKKRGKRNSDDEKLSDVSMEDSSSASTKGRKIGEIWKSNGVQYKIGPNGQRLRFELVKKARQKFVMPIDSIHPDRKANLEVYVEAWLTEEEYRDAKAQQILSWQESPKGSIEPETPPPTTPVIPSTPPRTGKHLLWDSTITTPSSKPYDNPFETAKTSTQQLTSTNNGASSKRIASAVRSTSGGSKTLTSGSIVPPNPSLMDSTNMRSPRTYKQFSKWEKQDLEAKAMMRMRESNRKKEEEKEKETIASTPPAVPKITFTPAADTGSGAKPPAFSLPAASTAPKMSFNAPALSSPLAGGENQTEAAKPPVSATPSFSFPKLSPAPASAQTPAATPTPQTNGGVNASPATPANPPAFSFGPPAGTNNVGNADKPKPTLGIGFPSTGASPTHQPTPQPAAALSTSSAAPKFSFNSTPKPAAAPISGTEQSKDASAANDGSSGGGSLLSRLGGAAPATSSTMPAFSFVKPAAPAASNTAATPSSFGGAFSAPSFGGVTSTSASAPQQPSTSTNAASNSAPPVKFNFLGDSNKAPSSSSSPFGIATSNASATPSSLSGALNPVPPSSAATTNQASSSFGSANSKSPEEGSTSSTMPAPKFNFNAPAPSSVGVAPKTGNIFGASQQSSTSNSASATAPSSFGSSSAFGGNSASGSGKSAANNNDNALPAFTSFGTPSTPSPFGVTSAGNNIFGSGNNAFNAKPTNSDNAMKPASTSMLVKPSETPSSDSTAPKSVFSFGSPAPSTSAFSKPSEMPSSESSAPKSAFAFNPSTPAPSTTPGSTSFGFGGSSNAFGAPAAAKPAGEPQSTSAFSFGSSNTATPSSTPAGEAPKSVFSFGITSTPVGTPAKTAFSFGAATPSGNAPAGGSSFPFGTPAGGSQTPSMFGGSSTPNNPFSAFASKPAGSETAK